MNRIVAYIGEDGEAVVIERQSGPKSHGFPPFLFEGEQMGRQKLTRIARKRCGLDKHGNIYDALWALAQHGYTVSKNNLLPKL